MGQVWQASMSVQVGISTLRLGVYQRALPLFKLLNRLETCLSILLTAPALLRVLCAVRMSHRVLCPAAHAVPGQRPRQDPHRHHGRRVAHQPHNTAGAGPDWFATLPSAGACSAHAAPSATGINGCNIIVCQHSVNTQGLSSWPQSALRKITRPQPLQAACMH